MIVENPRYQTIIDSTDASNVYYWYADLWKATTEAKWRIVKKVTAGSVVTEMYPIWITKYPVDDFSFQWSERDYYNYSLTPDFTAPTLSTVTIASNNITPTVADQWDIVTLTIVSSEAIRTPTITIGWFTATIVPGADALHWTATHTMSTLDTEWVVVFSVAFMDIWWNFWTTVTTKTGWSNVTFTKI